VCIVKCAVGYLGPCPGINSPPPFFRRAFMIDPSETSHGSTTPGAELEPGAVEPGAAPAPWPPPDEESVEARILRRLDSLDAKLDRLSPLLDMGTAGSGAVAAMVDVADEEVRRLSDQGVDADARLKRLLHLLLELTREDTLDRLEEAVKLARDLPGMLAAGVDVLDVEAGRLRDDGIDPMEAITNGARAAMEFGVAVGPREVRSLKTILASDALAPEAIEVVSLAANALVETRTRGCRPMGPLSLLGALRDPQVQKGLGFLVGVGQSFGAAMERPPSVPVLVPDLPEGPS